METSIETNCDKKFKHTNSQGVEITLGDFPEKNNLIITTIFNEI